MWGLSSGLWTEEQRKVHPREGTEMAASLPPLCTVREAAGACESRPLPRLWREKTRALKSRRVPAWAYPGPPACPERPRSPIPGSLSPRHRPTSWEEQAAPRAPVAPGSTQVAGEEQSVSAACGGQDDNRQWLKYTDSNQTFLKPNFLIFASDTSNYHAFH